METNKRLIFPVKLLPLLNREENVVLSPYGMKSILSMVAEGARDESLEQILFVFGFERLEELRESVLAVQDARCSAFNSDNSIKLHKGEENLELLSKFKQILEERYDASIIECVNSGEATLFLENVANFKAEWFHLMDRDASHKICFHNADGSESYPAFLSATRDYLRYYDNEDDKYIQAVAIPYKLKNERIPYELVLVDTKDELTAEVLERVFNNMRLERCELFFPEFSAKTKYDLVSVMKCLGLNTIFTPDFPGFDKIATQPLYAERFTQEAEIVVDKNGTVAKAVTKMNCLLGGFTNVAEKLIFNNPFHYFLRNTTTGEIVFMGKVNKLEDCNRTEQVVIPTLFGRVIV